MDGVDNDDEDTFGVNNDDDEDGLEVESEIDEEHIETLNQQQPLGSQLFVRGLPSDADEATVKSAFASFGDIRRVLFVENKTTKRQSGSAFVHFGEDAGADAAYNFAQKNATEATADVRNEDKAAVEGMSRHQAKKQLFKLTQDRFTHKDPFVNLMNTRVTVMRPMERTEAQDMTSGGKSKKERRTVTGSEDPRNLYLLEEGLIEPGSRAAQDLPPQYMDALQRDYETRKQQLRNTNLFLSKTRLSIRNIPKHVTLSELRATLLGQVKDFIKKNPKLKNKSLWGKHGPIKNARLLVDHSGNSRGYGFVEFCQHEFALHVLRTSNNNPTLFGPSKRLVISFAIENINALQKMERLKQLRKDRQDQVKRSGFIDRPGDDVDPFAHQLTQADDDAMVNENDDGGNNNGGAAAAASSSSLSTWTALPDSSFARPPAVAAAAKVNAPKKKEPSGAAAPAGKKKRHFAHRGKK